MVHTDQWRNQGADASFYTFQEKKYTEGPPGMRRKTHVEGPPGMQRKTHIEGPPGMRRNIHIEGPPGMQRKTHVYSLLVVLHCSITRLAISVTCVFLPSVLT